METGWKFAGAIGGALLLAALCGHRYYVNNLGTATAHTPVKADDLYNEAYSLFKRGRRDRNAVCLTIDDGPHAPSLPDILDALKTYHVKATFFMVGRRIEQNPAMVREVLREGHEIGNHTENHPRLDDLTPDQVRAEISLCQSSFALATGGAKMTLFRPPGMRFSPVLFKIAKEFGYTTVDWNIGAKDFKLTKAGPTIAGEERIADYILKQVVPGCIIVLHDSPDTAAALPEILEGLQQRGLRVETVTEMLSELPDPVIVSTNAGIDAKAPR